MILSNLNRRNLQYIYVEEVLKKIPGLAGYRIAEQISGGISNQNYRIISADPINNKDLVVTIYTSPETWWKADKEVLVTNLYKKYNIPSATILSNGYINNENQTYRYSLREFVKEKDFSILLHDEKNLSAKNWSSILTQLGTIMKTLHSISMTGYGLLREGSISGSDMSNISSSPSWQKYVDRLMLNRKYIVEKLNRNQIIGNITGSDIQNIFTSSYIFYKENRSVLEKVTQSSLIHYDVLLNNIIMNYNSRLNRWEISAIIDNEWVSAGDPDIDLVQIENAAYFSSQKEAFRTYWDFFTKSYMGGRRRVYSEDLNKKRLIYHMMRSLFYIIAVYGLDQTQTGFEETKNIKKIEANYLFVKKIINENEIDFSLFG